MPRSTPTPRRAAIAAVATVLALGGCDALKRFGYEGFGRDRWQQPEKVIEALAIAPGARVADLGAGSGYFTFRLADAVGPEGRVYAVDVDDGMLEHIADRAREESRRAVETVAAAPDDPRLPAPVDLIFTCNTYHHLADRTRYFRDAARYLRPGGRIAIIELRKRGLLQRLFPHATEPERIREEMEAAGYALEAQHDFLARQSFLVFRARG